MYFEIEKQAIDALNKALDQYDEDIDRNLKSIQGSYDIKELMEILSIFLMNQQLDFINMTSKDL